jgi:nucleoside-diphosphate-sugar epimerase
VLSGEKILVTGPAGQIAFPLCAHLARDNEVWGIARFGDPATRARVDALGVTTRVVDLATGDFGDLPRDFTYVLHLAATQSPEPDYDGALRINAEGTALLLEHCRGARAALVMSTFSVYRPHADPFHAYREHDPLGDANVVHSPTYSVSKIGQEAVGRSCARLFDLPVVIARMNASYGANGGLAAYHLDWIVAGDPVALRSDPCPYNPIHQDDINGQVGAMLAAAAVPARIVNWAGDEPVAAQEWCRYLGELTGREPNLVVRPVPGSQPGAVSDNAVRSALVGPCSVGWREGMRRLVAERYPDGIDAGHGTSDAAARLRAAYDERT